VAGPIGDDLSFLLIKMDHDCLGLKEEEALMSGVKLSMGKLWRHVPAPA
jgi:hypothetical protein